MRGDVPKNGPHFTFARFGSKIPPSERLVTAQPAGGWSSTAYTAAFVLGVAWRKTVKFVPGCTFGGMTQTAVPSEVPIPAFAGGGAG